ncbi:unnamed protein product [Symbiodinium natans]|uniref:Uncharacterized protein n=1 Tax=Symbiodinium natans TaxID=878477 RepID=A0A812JNH4_9DINO|nr:unnamed protein product [Symbiodinium natans]
MTSTTSMASMTSVPRWPLDPCMPNFHSNPRPEKVLRIFQTRHATVAAQVTVDSDAVPLVQFKTSASHAHKLNKGATRATDRTDRTGFLAEPANATTYGTWRLRSVYNSANCLNADAGGILSSNNCSTKLG